MIGSVHNPRECSSDAPARASLTDRLRALVQTGPPRSGAELALALASDRDTVRGLLQVLRERGEVRAIAHPAGGTAPGSQAFGMKHERQVWAWCGAPAVRSRVLRALDGGPRTVAQLCVALGADAAAVRALLLTERGRGTVASRLQGASLVWALTPSPSRS